MAEKLQLSTDELKKRDELNVHGEVGDKLKALSITLYVDEKKKLKIDVKEGQTATHGGRLISTKKRTVGEIKYPFDNIKSNLIYH